MARIRTIKPEFWTDEKVVELSAFARLLFIGIWNFCDDEGRMVYSPKRIKMQIFPADNVDCSELLGEIRGASLINVYTVDGIEYLQVSGFEKHQKIDKRSASKLPSPQVSAESPRITPTEGIKDQGMEGIKEGNGNTPAAAAKAAKGEYTDEFQKAWSAYPARPGSSKKDAFKAWSARLKNGVQPEIILAGIARYAAYCCAVGIEPNYIKQPETFFGPGEHYLSDWTLPTAKTLKVHQDLRKMDYTKGVTADGRF